MASRISNASEGAPLIAPEGAPLMVCVNDCALDHGQPYSELAPVCFRLGCAFAEARWRGVLAKNADIAHLVHIEVNQSLSSFRHR